MNFVPPNNKNAFYSALVWILSGISLIVYCLLGLFNAHIPGAEQLVQFLSSIEGEYLYLAAFISIFIEGLYFVGSFFPGTTLVIILTVLSQLVGISVFVATILTIFLGWSLAGAVNITLARMYHLKVAQLDAREDYEVRDRLWTTWFPAFRANYEVAQIADGGKPLSVFLSSVRVKLLVSVAAGLGALAVPFFIDIHEVSNEEGFFSVAIVAAISLTVGIAKMQKALRGE